MRAKDAQISDLREIPNVELGTLLFFFFSMHKS